MPYTINKTNGQLIATVQDGTIDNTTSLTLVGRNYTGYGSPVDENFIYLLENFSNSTAPSNPLTGQLWYNSTNNNLNVYNGSAFKSLSFITYGSQKPIGAIVGDLFYDGSQLWIYNGSDFIPIISQSSNGGSLSSISVKDETQNIHSVVEIPIGGNVATVIAKDQFSVYTGESIYSTYNNIYPGINLSGTNSQGISGYFTLNNYTATSQVGTLLWGTAASSLGLVDDSSGTPVIIRSNQLLTTAQLYSGLSPLYISDNNGLTIGTPKILQFHSTGTYNANISVINNGSPLNINLNTNAGTYTNVLQINDFSGLQILPSGNSTVALGSSANYFSTLYVTTVTSNTINATTISTNIVNAATASINVISANTASVAKLLTVGQVQSSGVSTGIVTATNIASTTIFGSQIYDTNARVLTTATIGMYGVTSLQGTANQITASAGIGSVTLSLPTTVAVTTVTATTISAAAGQVLSGGLPCLTAATVPSAGVGGVIGTANQVLVNGTSGIATTGTITLTLANPLKDSSGNAYLTAATPYVSTFAGGSTGLTPNNATSGAITLAGTLNASSGGTGNAGTLSGIPYANGTSAWSNVTSAQLAAAFGSQFTTNYMIKGSASGLVVSSLVFDNGTNVGIGQASPGAKLDVGGNIRLSAASPNIEFNNGGGMIYSTIGNTLQFATGGGPGSPSEKMRLDSSGNLHLYGGLYVTTTGLLKGNGSGSLVTAAGGSDITTALGYTPLHNVTSGYTGGSSVYVTGSAPASPTQGDIWLDTSGGTGYTQNVPNNILLSSNAGYYSYGGWTQLPNGIIIQWGQLANANAISNGSNFTFPIAFPHACLSLVGSVAVATATYGNQNNPTFWIQSTTAFGASSWDGTPIPHMFIAIGY